MSDQMGFVTSKDGTVIGYRRSGVGRPLLLVHGGTADHRRWTKITPYFEPHFTVIAMDRRGRGVSGDSPDYDIFREAEDIAAVVESFSEPVSILGHSYGGLCSLEASLLTDKVSKLILYEPDAPTGVSPIPLDLIERLQTLIDDGKLENALEIVFREIVEMPEHELEFYRNLPMWQIRISIAPTIPRELAIYWNYRFSPQRFSALQVPTMLLLGGNSPHIARQATEDIASALPDSRIELLPGEEHIAMDTNTDLFVGKVLQFLLA